MRSIFIKNIHNVKKVINELQRSLGVGLAVSSNLVTITGREEKIYDSERVLTALDAGFPVETALLLKDPEFLFVELRIRDITQRKNLKEVRARIIGTNGKTKKAIETISKCSLKVKDNSVFIIGNSLEVEDAKAALEKLIRGSKQSKVYSFLEKSRKKYKSKSGFLDDMIDHSSDDDSD